VAYGSDVKLVEKVLLDCAKAYKDIASDPTPFVRFNNFGESSLDFQLYFWTHNSFWVENIKSDMRFAIDKAFREHKIQIPFPQRDVHMKQKP
jgi:small-conductance mechanosensitive channel